MSIRNPYASPAEHLQCLPPCGRNRAPCWLVWLLAILLFVFPVTVGSFGGGSHLYALLVLPALWLGRGWQDLHGEEKKFLLGLLLVFAVMALSMIHTEDFSQGLRRLERYLQILFMVPCYLMLRRYRLDFSMLFGGALLLAILVMAGLAVYEAYWQDIPRSSGAYNAIVFADTAMLWGALAVLFALEHLRGWPALLLALLCGSAAILASLLSVGRGAWLFLPFFLLLLLWLYRHGLRQYRRVLPGIVVLLAVFAALFIWQDERLLSGIRDGMGDVAGFMQNPHADSSWGLRLNLWRNSLLIAAESPLLGTGQGDFQIEMLAMIADGRSWTAGVADLGHAHSIYFEALASSGLLGLLVMLAAYLIMPGLLFWRGIRKAHSRIEHFHAVAGFTVILAFAIFGLSEALWARKPFVNIYIFTLLVFMTGMWNARSVQQESCHDRE